ncbi:MULTISPECIES: DUF1566 domain-containing protein [Pseudoalteromonas]|uniref:Lcl C-terminal domain-containing protein n=1 Tax=Pseudoalteromonas amylolytica TaxID=1859457 RepID=A0A1S1MR48_9GAMM|nr:MULTISPECIES: DUF1566 domain-containing protein [Pseudoalteromonas]OHU86305.1 hypothetical protein BFC16_16520 [Pseudoalteromonas sp. JW3]OHU89590.1 hypothetical protein BET10_15800 [Pseudoalteromonas amylolytica]
MNRTKILPFVLGLLLAACGGGGGSDSGSNTENASINAGEDVTVLEKSLFSLSALVSPSGGTVSWQVLSGPNVEGFPQEGMEIEVTAPDVKSDSETVFKVDYLAPNGQVVSDQVSVFITSQNQLPIPVVLQTLPSEGQSQYLDTVELSAAESSDPDENGQVVGYLWEQVSGPTLSFSSTTEQTLQFVHPLLVTNQAAKFRLTVTDDEDGSASTEYSVTLLKADQPVIADAGEVQTAIEFDTVTLDATQSKTASGQFSCLWQHLVQTGQNTMVTINEPSQCITQFVAPDVDVTTELSFQVTVTDPNGYSATDTVTVNLEPKALGLIQDSGLDTCFDASTEIDCDDADYPEQDADIGRDSVADFLDKVGQGRAAFDYTKLNEFADELPDTASQFSCVRDNVNGLIWEVKLSGTGTLPNTDTRDSINHYTWHIDRVSDAAYPGSVVSPANSTCPSDTDCGIQAFIDEVNASNFCGGSNWRLPTYFELLSLIDFGRQGDSHLLDPDFFPNLPDAAELGHLYYWSAQTSVDGRSLTQAFILDMQTGNDLAYPKANTAYVRLVRTP